jgi:hypothetical protein
MNGIVNRNEEMAAFDHLKLANHDGPETCRYKLWFIEALKANRFQELMVLHEDDGSCCKKEPWSGTVLGLRCKRSSSDRQETRLKRPHMVPLSPLPDTKCNRHDREKSYASNEDADDGPDDGKVSLGLCPHVVPELVFSRQARRAVGAPCQQCRLRFLNASAATGTDHDGPRSGNWGESRSYHLFAEPASSATTRASAQAGALTAFPDDRRGQV